MCRAEPGSPLGGVHGPGKTCSLGKLPTALELTPKPEDVMSSFVAFS